MGIACSWSCCIDGSHRSSRQSRSSVPRLSYVGIGPASVGTGVGNPALLEADQRFACRVNRVVTRCSEEAPLFDSPSALPVFEVENEVIFRASAPSSMQNAW